MLAPQSLKPDGMSEMTAKDDLPCWHFMHTHDVRTRAFSAIVAELVSVSLELAQDHTESAQHLSWPAA